MSTIRSADPERDAAPARRSTRRTSRQRRPPSRTERADAAEMAARIERDRRDHPWLVAESEGEVVGFAYACRAPRAPRLPLGGRRLGLRRRRGPRARASAAPSTRRCSSACASSGFRIACAGITLPNEASVAPAREPRLRAGRRLPPDRLEGTAPGATSAGGSSSCSPGARGPARPEPRRRPATIEPCPRSPHRPTQPRRNPHRGGRLRGARGGHRPRARPRLRLPRPRLRRRDREGATSTSPSP